MCESDCASLSWIASGTESGTGTCRSVVIATVIGSVNRTGFWSANAIVFGIGIGSGSGSLESLVVWRSGIVLSLVRRLPRRPRLHLDAGYGSWRLSDSRGGRGGSRG